MYYVNIKLIESVELINKDDISRVKERIPALLEDRRFPNKL